MFTNPIPTPPSRRWGIDNRYGVWLIAGVIGFFLRPVRVARAFLRARREFAYLDEGKKL